MMRGRDRDRVGPGGRGNRAEHGVGLVEVLIAFAISTIVVGALGAILVATIRNSGSGARQQNATQQLRNGLFWLNQDTQSGVASEATVAAGDVTLRWTDYATGTQYESRIQQSGSELQRTLTVDGTPTTRVIARDLPANGFTVAQNGAALTYTLGVTNGTATQSQTETTMMRVGDIPLTPFATATTAPTRTATPTGTPVPTDTPTPTPTHTNTPTPTPTYTSTPTPTPTYTSTSTPTHTSTPTFTPTATPTPGCTGDTGWLSPSADAADTGGLGTGFNDDPAGAYDDGGAYASNTFALGERHRYYDYGIAIPPGCTVTGIEVRLDWWLSWISGGGSSLSVDLSWDGGTSWSSQQSDSNQTTTEHTVILGGAADLWGRGSWSSSDLSDANFRARIEMGGGFLATFYLDWAPIKVYYGGTASPTQTPTAANTSTPTFTSTRTSTPTPTNTPTPVPTSTNTPTPTSTPSCASGDTGLLSPSANAADNGGDDDGFESNPASAYANGGGNASNVNGNGDQHRYYDYGISLPAGCTTISGIVVRLDYWLQATNGTNNVRVQLSWDGGSNWTSLKTDSSEPQSQTAVNYGSSSDTWGRTWSAGELSDANFRVRVVMNLGTSWQDVYLDWIPVTVYYAP